MELQAARDQHGVFLPKEIYDEQIKEKQAADVEIKEKTLQLKAIEDELEKFKVSSLIFAVIPVHFENLFGVLREKELRNSRSNLILFLRCHCRIAFPFHDFPLLLWNISAAS